MSSTISISRGVFAFKCPKSKVTKKDSCDAYQYWRPNDDPFLRRKTFDNYMMCCEIVDAKYKDLELELHEKVFKELLTFVESSAGIQMDAENRGQHDSSRNIPTACILTGVNMPDHAATFKNLTQLIKENVSSYVASLQSRMCRNVKSAVFQLVSQLLGYQSLVNEEEEEEEEEENCEPFTTAGSSTNFKRNQCTMGVLSSWYMEEIAAKCEVSQKKRRRKASGDVDSRGSYHAKKPLVVILEDVENFSPLVLQDIILICHQYSGCLPFVFIFGVATNLLSVHSLLSLKASTCIAMKTFQAESSSYFLNLIIEKILMSSEVPFFVGGKIFKLLLDIFLYHDLSIKTFLKGFKLCLLQHFAECAASVLCMPGRQCELDIGSLPSCSLSVIRSLPSLTVNLDSMPSEEKDRILTDDDYFKLYIKDAVNELDCHFRRFYGLTKVLHTATASLPSHPLGKQIREVIETCLQGSLGENDGVKEAWKLLGLFAKPELTSTLESVISVLKDYSDDKKLSALCTSLEYFVERIRELDAKPCALSMDDAKPSELPNLKVKNRFELKEKLQELVKQKAKMLSPYENLKGEALEFLSNFLVEHLMPPSSLMLHEIYVFDDAASVKKQLIGMPRAAVVSALTNPNVYLQCSCCRLETSQSLKSSLPDISIVYKLYLECGRMINLYDWFQAFVVVVSDPGGQEQEEEQKLQARFTQAVTELQFLGFIKATKRKTDHVLRLCWANC